MKVQTTWKDRMRFTATAEHHAVEMDAKAPIGSDSAMSPKQLLLAGICGCTGMDVVALLKKYRQPLESFQVDAEGSLSEGKYPAVFAEVQLTFRLKGALDPGKVMEAVKLSQTKYCGVSAMVSRAVPITYKVELNGQSIGTGKAQFD